MSIPCRPQVACVWLVLMAVLGTSSCTTPPEDEALITRIDRALAKAARFMISKQSADGAWRSETYGSLKQGTALTPPVLKCLFFTPEPSADSRASFRKGVDYLMRWVGEDGRIHTGGRTLDFPVYTAALASDVIGLESQDPAHRRAQSAWLKFLLEFRLDKHLGWDSRDPGFGGWGYAIHVPRKPEGSEAPYEANLSASIFGIAALRQAGVPSDDALYQEILGFVKTCQNFSDDPQIMDPGFDDGGFFFTPCDPARNKAGVAGTDTSGRDRYNSYGSTTADGLRALLRCGLPPDNPRVRAAQRWLETHFSATTNPGRFARDREVLSKATYYYYCWSVAHAFMALRVQEFRTKNRAVNWAKALAGELIQRQQADGAWFNRFTDTKEDDPLIATPLATAALTLCRYALEGDNVHPAKQLCGWRGHPTGSAAK